METWDKLPLNLMDELAELETYNRVHYRPIYSIHKWWAPRPGSTFRILGLAALTGEETTHQDILHMNQSRTRYGGLFIQSNDFEGQTILDPFAGGGTTLVESSRLGADVVGYELNPVAWWKNKKMMDDVDVQSLRSASEQVLSNVRDEIGDLYKTTVPETGQDAEILYSFQAQVLPCLTCDEEVELVKNYYLGEKKKTQPAVLFCPNSDCGDRIIEIDTDVPETIKCDSCGTQFDPSSGNARSAGGKVKYSCSNGHTHNVRETLNRLDEKPEFRYFAIQYLDRTGEKGFKQVDEEDRKVIEKTRERLDEEFESLPIPTQQIPTGDKLSRLTTRNYESFDELFSARHLITYGKLFKHAKEYDDRNISEFLITAISNSLKRASQLTKWDYHDKKATNVFARKSYIPRVEPVEGNPLNRIDNVCSIEGFFNMVTDGMEYAQNPFEKLKEDGNINKYSIDGESVHGNLQSLKCSTSENLHLEDGVVDYVITDPPYYDNIQYSELSEYFYVWLHKVLADEYEEFAPEHVPSAREIVKNERMGKEEEFFIESLSNVFSECYRVLKEDGELVFTYHHNENEAWSVILQALIESGFTMTGAYPVQSEMPGSMTIKELENAEYDILVFANKESTSEDITLTELRQNLFFELQDMASEERERHEDLSKADLGVILRGKCMYYYSRHYPNVYSEGEQAGIDEALDTVDSIIEQVLEGSVNLPASIDSMSEAYAAFVQRGPEGYDDLNKQLLAKNLNVTDLEDEKLVKGPRDRKEPVSADERVHHIERKLSKSGNGSQQTLGGDEVDDALLDVDKVQYLYHLYKTDQNTSEYLSEWKTDDLQELAEFLADATGDDRYENVMEMSLSQF